MTIKHTYDESKVIAKSELNGWVLGYIGVPWLGPWPKKNGDLFVADPDGGQAGLAWETSGPEIIKISGANESRWGVFQVLFPIQVWCEDDLIRNFHLILPKLMKMRASIAS